MNKSVIYFNQEKMWMTENNNQYFCSPFTLSETDENCPMKELRGRMIKALSKRGYEHEFVQWNARRIIYRKPKS